ncbi:hypothetical protein ATE84_4138 [Aquimarina sp. MAR_2010_214]|uniref:hypothetical protein n=1 Tax=Aquimarina sp. MAR_2010_214 TaxID=1250026 RepID=UPI000C70646C|nr:hypothetical protein [Aquimarina sp. MAR_2010_214]PKV52037.1 hypothetical protein ATE84_4138 [Aquimarina sp. MAR_2010_214]
MDHLEYNSKYRFMSDILKTLHLKTDIFMYNLAHHTPYEMILYRWINKLYTKGTSSEEAIQLIYKARNILLLTQKNSWCNPPKPIDTPS